MMARQDYLGSGRSFSEENDRKALQELVAKGYRHCVRRTYFLRLIPKPNANLLPSWPLDLRLINRGELYVPNAASFSKRWNALQECLTSLCESPQAEGFAAADVGFSMEGLRKLGIRQNLLEVFKRKSPAFDEGAHARAHRHLLDTSESDPAMWVDPYGSSKSQRAFDVVVFMHLAAQHGSPYSVSDDLLLKAERCIVDSLTDDLIIANESVLSTPLTGWWVETATPLDKHGHEHFGYRDGITQPQYRSDKDAKRDSASNGYREVHALGEVLLGHKRNEGDNPYADLGLTLKAQAHWEPSITPRDHADTSFFLNSSFGVLRRMEQRVEAFEAWIKQQATKHFPQDSADGLSLGSGDSDLYTLRKAWIKAKLLGRTPEGTRLMPQMTWTDFSSSRSQDTHHEGKKATTQALPVMGNEGGFHRRGADGRPSVDDDSRGAGCPFSSHIRRMNPQDDPISPFIHRPLLRRGLPYIELSADGNRVGAGLAGLFICADLVEQFEHLVGVWAQHRVMGLSEQTQCRDPLIGNHSDASPQNVLTLLTPEGKKIELTLDETFVITRGCAYIWLPSKDTLSQLGHYT
jgi:deferrochelatase/peroxidase EfeB